MVFIELLLQRKLSFIRVYMQVIWWGFLAHVQQFSYLLNKFEVWVSFEAVCNILDRFFSLIFQNEIQSFARLQSLKLVCFILWKLCRLFLTRSLQDGDFRSVLNQGRRRVKTLQILVEFF